MDNKQSLYKHSLLKHYRHPHNKCEGEIQGADLIQRGSNPRCGDDIEIGLYLDQQRVHVDQVKFRGRGCSVCIASSSMMTQTVSGRSVDEARKLSGEMKDWLQGSNGDENIDLPDDLQTLDAVREYPARRRCVLLPWEALADALEQI